MTKVKTPAKAKVLAVDDDPDVLKLHEAILNREGFEVALAPDGATALRKAQAEPPDVILLDLMMPRMDGFTVLEKLKERERVPRIICLTAKAGFRDREKAWRMGVDDYVTKPFKVDKLVKTLGSVAGRGWATRESKRRAALDDLAWT